MADFNPFVMNDPAAGPKADAEPTLAQYLGSIAIAGTTLATEVIKAQNTQGGGNSATLPPRTAELSPSGPSLFAGITGTTLLIGATIYWFLFRKKK